MHEFMSGGFLGRISKCENPTVQYHDAQNILHQTPARICMHRKVSFFRSMKLTRNRSFILVKIQRKF